MPSHTVTIGERVAASQVAPSTANGFMASYAERGPTDRALLVVSLADFATHYGERVSGHSELYDAVDVAFRDGASAIYVARRAGEKLASASVEAVDSEGKKSMKLAAISAGAWGSNLKVEIETEGESFTLTVKEGEDLVEASPALATLAEAIAWAKANSTRLVISAGSESEKDPKKQTVSLTGGKDDYAGKQADLEAALALFRADLGPGQVSAPGETSEEAHEAIAAHVAATNRRGLLDLEDTGKVEDLVADGTALRALEGQAARYCAAFSTWALVPGITKGTYRTVPWSAVQTGLIARAEAEGFSPNQAAAGKRRGASRYAVGITHEFTDAEREDLDAAGISAVILRRGVPTTFGDRTLTNQLTDGGWASFANSRLVMAVAGLSDEVLDDYDFEDIDGRGLVFAKLQGDLSGRACMPFYLANSLYGQTPEEAFQVKVGPDVNTPTTISEGKLRAQIALHVSPTGGPLEVEIVKVPITESLG